MKNENISLLKHHGYKHIHNWVSATHPFTGHIIITQFCHKRFVIGEYRGRTLELKSLSVIVDPDMIYGVARPSRKKALSI